MPNSPWPPNHPNHPDYQHPSPNPNPHEPGTYPYFMWNINNHVVGGFTPPPQSQWAVAGSPMFSIEDDPEPSEPFHNPDYFEESSLANTHYISTIGSTYEDMPAKKVSQTKPVEKGYNLPINLVYPKVPSPKNEDHAVPMPFIPPEKVVGVEIECEGMHLFKTPVTWWVAKGDHSLRPYRGHEPIEYVLREPIERSELDTALDYLLKRLARKKTELNLSERCSVHVHVNCQQMLMRQVLTFACLYMVLEELLVSWCGNTRVGNMFCLRAVDAHNYVQTIAKCIEGDQYGLLKQDNVRYTSCNLAALGKFGSLEFRALRGTSDKQTILDWVDMLLNIRSASMKMDDPRDIITAFESLGPENFLAWALDSKQKLFPYNERVKNSLWNGIRMIREIAFASEWLPPLEKKSRTQRKAKAA